MMTDEKTRLLSALNAETKHERLDNLQKIIDSETKKPVPLSQFANNHIHTAYSFSPYSPTAAVYFARLSGLQTAGIMDHDSIAGAFEFIEAGKIAGIATTVGLECRVRVDGTPIANKRINNPDQKGIAYMALHGVPHHKIDYLQQYFAPLRENRNVRNRIMTDNINIIFKPYGISLSFENDILPISQFSNGGAVTERHLLYALTLKISEKIGKENISTFLESELKIVLGEKQKTQLRDIDSEFFCYDVLGILKQSIIERIYVPATDECIHINELTKLSKDIDALLCYAYLGDVSDSVTGDKKAQHFEDSYLPLLFDFLKETGIDAITYMPSRNSPAQLETIQKMCRERDIMEISGEDINSPRQSFICRQLEQPEFSHLIDATWKLIERENRKSFTA